MTRESRGPAVAERSPVRDRPGPARPADRPQVDGKFLRVRGERLWARSVTYGSFAANEAGEPFPPFARLRDDFARMRDSGINSVRIYGPPSDRIADAAADLGLYLIADLCWGPRSSELSDPAVVRSMIEHTGRHARRLAGHPAMLLHGIGNEIPPLTVRWYGSERVERFLRELHDAVKAEDPRALVTYSNHPPTEYLKLPFLDVVSFNVYLHDERAFRAYLSRLQTLADTRPLYLSELGMDSAAHGVEAQARFLDGHLRAAFERGACGTAVYAWTDEWSIFDHDIDGWSFGITDRERRPKPALSAVADVYGRDLYRLRRTPWPRVSVVVSVYNGGATLDECLRSLEQQSYPDCELIVVDDGSTDDTPEIVRRHRVRGIRVPNGGLGRARNLGIEAATGSIVAFLDSDAFADPDWLFFLVTALEEQDADAVGGPNLSPPGDGFVAQCVDRAPGNPTHVLMDDALAEHVAGCNMALRRDALREIGMFDGDHRAAGDDVDVCWKLLVRGRRIAFSPCATVWHHRRGTVAAFWRQQLGYGRAEAHLRRRYPGRFNVFGDLVWSGRIYDSAHVSLRKNGVSALARPRIYHGRFGGAPFQTLYQPFPRLGFLALTTAEWQALSWCVLLAAALALTSSGAAAAALLAVGAAMLLGSLAAAAVPAVHAVRDRRWRGRRAVHGLLLITALDLLQPLARTLGHLLGWWETRRAPAAAPTAWRVWGNLEQRHRWLERLEHHLRACGWVCRTGEWDACDLEVVGPGPHRIRLSSTCEEDLAHGHHFVRFRVTARRKAWVPAAWLALGLAGGACAAHPFLLPLAVPLLGTAGVLARARSYMTRAVAQMAVECAEAHGMPGAE